MAMTPKPPPVQPVQRPHVTVHEPGCARLVQGGVCDCPSFIGTIEEREAPAEPGVQIDGQGLEPCAEKED